MDIAFCINNKYVNHLIVVVFSLLAHNKNQDLRVHILSSDITAESRHAIDSLKQQNKQLEIVYHAVNAVDFGKLNITMDYISRETYYRLILAEVLPKKVKRVLYLDADLLIQGSLSELFATPLDGYYAAGAPDIYLNDDIEYKKSINVEPNTYVNAGVLLFNLEKLRKDKMTQKLLTAAKRKSHRYQDQDAINVTLAGKILPLDVKYNHQIKDKQYNETLEGAVVLHYSGSLKPWNRDRPYDVYSALYDKYKLQSSRYINEHNQNVKYGLLKYSTDNVGDSVQGIAARKFLPHVDYYFERDNMDATQTNPGETVKVIINGWWGDGPENWPPIDQNLEVLPISMYVEDRIQAEFKKPRSKAILQHFGPVGARSHGTKKFLDDTGVESYFSGCLTLTLNADKNVKKRDYVLAVDVPDSVYERMRQQTDRKIIRIGVLRQLTGDVDEQYRLAELYLYLYQSAHAVVTTRLHSMLPSLALGTPVLFINDILNHDDVRFSGLSVLAHNLRSKDYIAHPEKFDINNPPANSKDYLLIRKDLEKRCKAFTGHMGNESYLTKPLPELLIDANLIQAAIGGASALGDLKEQNDNLTVALSHKENHVNELVNELSELRKKYDEAMQSLSWRLTKPLRAGTRVKGGKR